MGINSEFVRYEHILTRVEHPLERGYRMQAYPLPDWIHIRINRDSSSKWLTVHSRLHINKCVKVGPSYSLDFSDRDIIKDQSAPISIRFLN